MLLTPCCMVLLVMQSTWNTEYFVDCLMYNILKKRVKVKVSLNYNYINNIDHLDSYFIPDIIIMNKHGMVSYYYTTACF